LCLSAVALPDVGTDRVSALTNRLLAPCCWRESVSVHKSPVADDLRQRITTEVAEGRSDEAILNSLIREYGKRILREPEGAQQHWLYWIPVVAVVLAALALARFLRRSTASQPLAAAAGPMPNIDFLEED
jgi:cytochrome c-type biogenesis protein CcmH